MAPFRKFSISPFLWFLLGMFTSAQKIQQRKSFFFLHYFEEKSFWAFGVKTIQWIKICQIELDSRKVL